MTKNRDFKVSIPESLGFDDFVKAANLSFIEGEIVRSRQKIEGAEKLTLKVLGVKFSLSPERIRQKYMIGMQKLRRYLNTSSVPPVDIFNKVLDLYQGTVETLSWVNLVTGMGNSRWDREIKRLSPEAQEFLKLKFSLASNSTEVLLLLLSTSTLELRKMSSNRAYYCTTTDSEVVIELKGMLSNYCIPPGCIDKKMTEFIRYNPLRDILKD